MPATEHDGSADRDVGRFLSDVVHDLRNLLDGVTMTLPAERPRTPERALQETTFRNIYDILRKVEDYVARAQPISRKDGKSELSPMVQRVLKTLQLFFRERKVSVTTKDDVWVAVDSRALRRMLENILHVASKRAAPGGDIRISMKTGEAVDLTFEVTLATPTTVDELFSEKFHGGLDLWVSRETARSYGGDLVGDREGDDLRLVLTLPRPASAEPTPTSESKRRVLIVDDNLDTAKSLAILLDAAGFETETCHDGASALEAVPSFRPDALVLDLGLPGMDGGEVCRQVRREPGGERMLVLAVSGRGDDDTLAAVRDAGFDDHFLKPVDHGELIRRLRA